MEKRDDFYCRIFVLLGIFFVVDYIGVVQYKRPPVYRYKTTTVFNESKLIEYQNLFYNVYRINADTPNEYYLIDSTKQYTIDTVPVSPFDMDKSDVEHLIEYKSNYVGDNSNTGNLIGALPLSEYGYVFEIDSEKNGITISYHFTDWYQNENSYIEKALIYNSVSSFALIENLQYINYNFSGSSYSITRETMEQKYPNYKNIFIGHTIDTDKFKQYVDEKINNQSFVSDIFKLFKKTDL